MINSDPQTDLLEEFGIEDGGFHGKLPEGRHVRVENKNFYFDVGQNNRGVFMRISEVDAVNSVHSVIFFQTFEQINKSEQFS